MTDECRAMKGAKEEEDFVTIEEEEVDGGRTLPLCLIGKVLTGKPFNAFGFLEAMKRAMNPSKGFTAKEIGPNLFSFNFKSHDDLMEVKRREPWHFEKSLVILKEIEKGEQPSVVSFRKTNMWIMLYDLPMAARSTKYIQSIASRCGEVVEIDKDSTKGFGRSIRVKELLNIHEDKLPFGEWIKASPAKKASVTTAHTKETRVTSPLRRRLFEKLKAALEDENKGTMENKEKGTTSSANEVNEISEDLKRVTMGNEMQKQGRWLNETVEQLGDDGQENKGDIVKTEGDIALKKEEFLTSIPAQSSYTESQNCSNPLIPTSTLKAMCNNSKTNTHQPHQIPHSRNPTPPTTVKDHTWKTHPNQHISPMLDTSPLSITTQLETQSTSTETNTNPHPSAIHTKPNPHTLLTPKIEPNTQTSHVRDPNQPTNNPSPHEYPYDQKKVVTLKTRQNTPPNRNTKQKNSPPSLRMPQAVRKRRAETGIPENHPEKRNKLSLTENNHAKTKLSAAAVDQPRREL
ncbi:hypothetical protein ACS0TY_035514 [Phlomoides rotata]